jgi:hypothetical protein
MTSGLGVVTRETAESLVLKRCPLSRTLPATPAGSAVSLVPASGQAIVGADSSSSLREVPSITNSAAPRNTFIASVSAEKLSVSRS